MLHIQLMPHIQLKQAVKLDHTKAKPLAAVRMVTPLSDRLGVIRC